MLHVSRATVRAAVILFFCLTWIIDPAFAGIVGQEGLFRWGALVLVSLLAIGTPSTWTFLASRTFFFHATLVGVMLISTSASGSSAGYLEALRLAPICLVAPVVVSINSTGNRERFKSLIVALLMAVAASSIAAGYLGNRFVDGRLYGISWHPNALTLCAATLCTIVVLSPLSSRLLSAACLLVGGAAVVLSDSLLGMIMVLTAIIGGLVRQWLGLATAMAAMFAVVALLLAAPPIITIFLPDYTSWFGLVDLSTFQRLVIWRDALQNFLDNPVLGTGFADAQSVYDLRSLVTVNYSHSVVFTYLRTTGLAGFVSMFVLIMHVTRRTVRSSASDDLMSLSLLLPSLAMSAVEAGLQQMPLSWIIFWLAIGFAEPKRSDVPQKATAYAASP